MTETDIHENGIRVIADSVRLPSAADYAAFTYYSKTGQADVNRVTNCDFIPTQSRQ
jgi:hypothetical protein